MSTGRQEAFEIFKRDYTQNSNIEDNKDALKAKYEKLKLINQRII
jgi:kinesin family protein 6/9